jgi:hypothetical protein
VERDLRGKDEGFGEAGEGSGDTKRTATPHVAIGPQPSVHPTSTSLEQGAAVLSPLGSRPCGLAAGCKDVALRLDSLQPAERHASQMVCEGVAVIDYR